MMDNGDSSSRGAAPTLLTPPGGKPHRSLARLLSEWSRGRVAYFERVMTAEPRWGHSCPAHPELTEQVASGDADYEAFMGRVMANRVYFECISRVPAGDAAPFWTNGWFPPTDAVALSQLLFERRPRLMLEIGSGNSTKFARRAIELNKLPTKLISIDPEPRASIDHLCDECLRTTLEQCDPSLFDQLQPGDFLFVDSSHRALMNSDVTVLFLEILPRLRPGVIVHFHDIWLPFDYPARWRHLHFSEQYLLACLLLYSPERWRITFPSMYVSGHARLGQVLQPLWSSLGLTCPTHGGSFWLEVLPRGGTRE